MERRHNHRRVCFSAVALLVGALVVPATQFSPAPAEAQVVGHGSQIVLASGLAGPVSVASDAAGDVFVADTLHDRVLALTKLKVGYSAPATLPFPDLGYVMAVAVDAQGDVFAVGGSHSTPTSTLFELPKAAVGYSAVISLPMDPNYAPSAVAVDSSGNLFLSGDLNGETPLVELPRVSGHYGSPIDLGDSVKTIGWLTNVAVDPDDNLLVTNGGGIYLIPRIGSGWGSANLVPYTQGFVEGLAVGSTGDLYWSATQTSSAWESPKVPGGYGLPVQLPFGSLPQARGVAVDQNGDVFLVDMDKGELLEVPAVPAQPGYWLVARDGGVFSFGKGTPFYGSESGYQLSYPIVGMAADPAHSEYWLVDSSGQIYGAGTPYVTGYGMLTVPPAHPIVGIAVAPGGGGYWLVGSDGGIFAFGVARFYGSTGGLHLNQPIVGMAVDPATGGYWLVAADGGVFSFNAPFYGSTGGIHLNQPIVGMAAAPNGKGYWLVAKDGGIFAFGSGARFYGSTGSIHLNQPIVGMAVDQDSGGYWLVASDGGVFAFNAPFLGSTGGVHLTRPITSIATAN